MNTSGIISKTYLEDNYSGNTLIDNKISGDIQWEKEFGIISGISGYIDYEFSGQIALDIENAIIDYSGYIEEEFSGNLIINGQINDAVISGIDYFSGEISGQIYNSISGAVEEDGIIYDAVSGYFNDNGFLSGYLYEQMSGFMEFVLSGISGGSIYLNVPTTPLP